MRLSFWILALLLLRLPLAAVEFSATSAPEWDALFRKTNGWIGADGAYSIPLSRNKTLWLFSDTWVGTVRDGKRVHPRMINNSIAIQENGKAPQFFYRTNSSNGQADAFIKPENGRGFYWLFSGGRSRDDLFFFLKQVEIVNPGSVFGFKGFNTSLARIRNPGRDPMKWEIEQMQFPFSKYGEKESLVFGMAVMQDKGFIYVYGNNSGAGRGEKGVVVARVPERKVFDFDEWRFYSNGKWVTDFMDSSSISADAPPEASVSYWPAAKKYVFVHVQGIWGKLVVRTADSPVGPWSEPIPLYDAPEMKYPRKVFCYAGKAHPQLGTSRNELIVTYASNSFDVGQVIEDARLYFPHFVRVKLLK